MATDKNDVMIKRDDGSIVAGKAPVIISASRSTDIPAFYADWFFERLEKGYSAWKNPFNGKYSYISYQDTRFIVFWSKNPTPLLKYLDKLQEKNINCYVQYTLNDYVVEGLEKGVPSVEKRIATFKALVDKLGKGHVIWRFDPLILTDKIDVDALLNKIEYIGDKLLGYTEKLVFSFVDIVSYRKVKSNLEKNGVHYVEWTDEKMHDFAKKLAKLNQKWGYQLATCAEKVALEEYGIEHNRCVDDELMIKLAYHDKVLMKYLGVEVKDLVVAQSLFGEEEVAPEGAILLSDGRYAVRMKNNKDKGQREHCGCIVSKDIGEYNTCPHQCEYCYANTSKEQALNNFKRHREKPNAETITGM